VTLSVIYKLWTDREENVGWTSQGKWGISITCISLVFAGVGMICSIAEVRGAFIVESILIIIEVVLWAVAYTVSLLTNNFDNVISSENNFSISDPNLFFWGSIALIASILLLSNWFRAFYLQSEDALNVTSWMFMSVAGFVVLLSGIAYRTENYAQPEAGEDEDNLTTQDACLVDDSVSCARVHFSIVLGGLSASICAVVVPFRTAPIKCQQEVAFLLFVAWCCGVGFLTYGTGKFDHGCKFMRWSHVVIDGSWPFYALLN
jgi:hypothetical protein